MIQKDFAQHVAALVQEDSSLLGLAVGGSWLTGELDQFSDLDLVLVTQEKITDSKEQMLAYARRFGTLLTAFTGEHVGEPRLLICLYDQPLLHVDLKFVTLEEFATRVENPALLVDKGGQLKQVISQTEARFPFPDYQWIEDRFWIWVHYALLKIGRGEYVEALDFFGYLRMTVFGPLLHLKNGNLPRGVRKVETMLAPEDLARLQATVCTDLNKAALMEALENAIALYQHLRTALYNEQIHQHQVTEERVKAFLQEIKSQEA
ncbi:aminoglycoside 6-adenylyltransferase [Sabulibacter ruber]|uniref:aminoglycoside 6-adenylyltransferase n=1 Tax=Sabulibacter ruber TaxID=2811901 RepID=UPI001A974965|nr:aminoglycoside 6-adenylyltransferase [Sabulibacter ruber]